MLRFYVGKRSFSLKVPTKIPAVRPKLIIRDARCMAFPTPSLINTSSPLLQLTVQQQTTTTAVEEVAIRSF